MRFLDALFWIIVIYIIYYGIVILYDAVMKRSVKDITGVQEFTVVRPDDTPTQVRDESKFIPTPVSVVSDTGKTLADEESDGSGSIAEKKKLTTENKENKYKMGNLKSDFQVDGQPLEIQFSIDEFMKQALEEDSPLRKAAREQARALIY
jgi:hypothetical protein